MWTGTAASTGAHCTPADPSTPGRSSASMCGFGSGRLRAPSGARRSSCSRVYRARLDCGRRRRATHAGRGRVKTNYRARDRARMPSTVPSAPGRAPCRAPCKAPCKALCRARGGPHTHHRAQRSPPPVRSSLRVSVSVLGRTRLLDCSRHEIRRF